MTYLRPPSLAFALALAVAGCPTTDEAAPDGSLDAADRFVGTWTYDLPNPATGVNVATLRCPDPEVPELALPQIGTLAFRRTAPGRLEGQTDQGCTWTFEVEGTTAELSPADQACHNQVFDLGYTIHRWTLGLDGDRGDERLEATSVNGGMDCTFDLPMARRTRATAAGDVAAAFVGTWHPGHPDPTSGGNIAQVVCPAGEPGGPPSVRFERLIGPVQMTRTGDTTLTAVDAEGCRFDLEVLGNLASLEGGEQSCTRSDGAVVSVSFWAFAAEGDRAFEIVSGTRTEGGATCAYVVGAGELGR
jgi:hypothetical protein